MKIFENFFSQIRAVIDNGVFGISLLDLGIILISIIFALLIRSIFAKLIVSKVKKFVKKTTTEVDDHLFDALIPPFKLLPIVLVFLVITLYFEIDSTLGLYFQKINNTLSTIFVFWLIHQSLIPLSNFFSKLEKILTKALVLWIIRSLKYLIIFLGIVAVLEVWGIKIGPVIAGLGLFGVAVALGAQDLFKNLISGIMILLEKRFHIGDVINVPGHTEGMVEHIGFRSTLIRKFDSTPITIPNYIFAEAPILNYTNRTNRRINWTVGLEYSSTLDQIKHLTEFLRNYLIQSEDFTVNENYKAFVRLDKFNDSSIDILIYCFTSTNDWEKFLEIKEKLAMEIKRKVEELNLNFAFPSQSIYIEKNI
jgi:MscS family membrane protein